MKAAITDHGLDTSHRGGPPGFIVISSDNQLRIPDYSGNNIFNTLGNFQSYPQAGLVFIDFQQHRLLQLTGKSKILWDVDALSDETGGTQRYWEFEMDAWREIQLPFELEWELLDYSPFISKIKYG